jgi:phosphoribosylformimino-5-aminoimidazole carboxamide ribotide isomerase
LIDMSGGRVFINHRTFFRVKPIVQKEGIMRILPVIDVRGGHVVRGVGGRRADYRPLVSPLSPTSRPLDVARGFRTRFGLSEIYVADLDAIAGGPPDQTTISALIDDGFRPWVDAGIRDYVDVHPLIEVGVEDVVVGIETVTGPGVLRTILPEHGERIIFSLDLRAGEPLGNRQVWLGYDAWGIAECVIGLGVRRLLVLDLARVGMAQGLGTDALSAFLANKYPEVEISAGGGVRGPADLGRLRASGVRAVLVASAFHDGTLTPADAELLGGA